MADVQRWLFLAAVVLAVTLINSSNVEKVYVIRSGDNGNFKLSDTRTNDWVAEATFANWINTTGWSYLSVTTNPASTNEDQAYAAGLAEGSKTASLIKMHWYNTIQDQFCPPPLSHSCRELRKFLQTNIDWMKQQIATNDTDYWHMIKLFLIQVSGLTDGYFNDMKGPSMDVDPFGLIVLSLSGDMEDLPSALNLPVKKSKVKGSGSCSALIKMLPGYKDLFTAHDTWDTYQSMLRMLKNYDFGFHSIAKKNGGFVPGKRITMSSYPGVLLSGDDFYLISSGLASQETTIGNSNPDLYKYVNSTTVMEGIRTMVANRIAVDGQSWAQVFAEFNSGTYNNQWMIVDYSKFMPGFAPSNGLLTILEQIPGTVTYKDMTAKLIEQSYWPSYNIPYFSDIYNKSGWWGNVAKYGDWFTYDKSPRAQIFHREQGKVTDVDSMRKLMRYNNFQHDPMSRCNCTPPYSAENAISARCDLNPADGKYPFGALGHRSHGGTDMKLTSSGMFVDLMFMAISGPTFDQLPPFQWSKADFASECPHQGHPDVFKFDHVFFNGTFT